MTRDELAHKIEVIARYGDDHAEYVPWSERMDKIMALIDEYAGYKVGLVIKEWQEDRR